ncbi:hypothetical protein OSTOST_03853 [Ostertagia ostertagi]
MCLFCLTGYFCEFVLEIANFRKFFIAKADDRVRLRRRDSSKNDAVEAGFEPSTAVPRCHSTHSLAYANSQFQASDLNLSHPHSRRAGREYDIPPTAVVGPRQCIRATHVTSEDRGRHHHSQNDIEHYRRSLQQLNGESRHPLAFFLSFFSVFQTNRLWQCLI